MLPLPRWMVVTHLALPLVYVLVHMWAGLATSSGLGPRGRDGFGSPGDGSRLDPKCKLIFYTVYTHIQYNSSRAQLTKKVTSVDC